MKASTSQAYIDKLEQQYAQDQAAVQSQLADIQQERKRKLEDIQSETDQDLQDYRSQSQAKLDQQVHTLEESLQTQVKSQAAVYERNYHDQSGLLVDQLVKEVIQAYGSG